MASTKEISDRVYENLKNEVTLTDRQKFEVLKDVEARLLVDVNDERDKLSARLEFLGGINNDFNNATAITANSGVIR